MSLFTPDAYWKSKEKPCPYVEGKKCFLVLEPNDESCSGCNWYRYVHGETDIRWPEKEDEE